MMFKNKPSFLPPMNVESFSARILCYMSSSFLFLLIIWEIGVNSRPIPNDWFTIFYFPDCLAYWKISTINSGLILVKGLILSFDVLKVLWLKVFENIPEFAIKVLKALLVILSYLDIEDVRLSLFFYFRNLTY